jgi:hypothetical protein
MADIQLSQPQFEEVIADRGKTVIWRAAYRCTCRNAASGAPQDGCKACSGAGYIYQAPYTVTALMSGIDTKKDFLPAGEWHNGDITCTVPNRLRRFRPLDPPLFGNEVLWDPNPMWSIGEWDLVTLPDSEQRTSEVLTYGQAIWRRPADTLLQPKDAMRDIISLLVADPVSGGVTYFTAGVAGTDFTLVNDVVTWDPASTADYTVTGNVVNFNPSGVNVQGMQTGTAYSVTYTHFTTYYVYQTVPQARDYDGQKMPRKVMLRLKDVGAHRA